MKILIIGGKKFVGYHIAKAAMEKGHEVTFFNRGKTNADWLPDIPVIIGDRNTDMDKLVGIEFDAVIDTCGYFPQQVEKSLDVLKDNVSRYLFISSMAVVNSDTPGFDESVPIVEADYTSEKITRESYGKLKVACEEVLMKGMDRDKTLIIRPGYIVGAYDYTDRFTFWPVMIKNLDTMPIPPMGDMPFMFIDMEDLAAFAIGALEQSLSGVYHLAGPKKPILFSDFIETCRKVFNPDCKWKELEDKWFDDQEQSKPSLFPLFNDFPEGRILFSANVDKAFNDGMKMKALEETIKDATEWFEEVKGDPQELAAGMKFDQLKSLI